MIFSLQNTPAKRAKEWGVLSSETLLFSLQFFQHILAAKASETLPWHIPKWTVYCCSFLYLEKFFTSFCFNYCILLFCCLVVFCYFILVFLNIFGLLLFHFFLSIYKIIHTSFTRLLFLEQHQKNHTIYASLHQVFRRKRSWCIKQFMVKKANRICYLVLLYFVSTCAFLVVFFDATADSFLWVLIDNTSIQVAVIQELKLIIEMEFKVYILLVLYFSRLIFFPCFN